jgi:hypothetical protein
LVNLDRIAERLDSDERFRLKYRFPVRAADGQVDFEVREGKLLDVAEEAKLLYVSHKGEVIWVKLEEAIEIVADGT